MNRFWNMMAGGLAVGCATAAGVAATPYKILPLGDSITAGNEFPGGVGVSHGGYRPALYSMLNAAKPGGYDFVGSFAGTYPLPDGTTGVETPPTDPADAAAFATYDNNHTGVPGAAIYDFTPGLYGGYASPYDVSSIVTATNPDAILLNLGTNDLQGFNLVNGNYSPADSPADAVYSMEALLTRIFAAKPTVKVYLGGLIGLPEGVNKGEYTNDRVEAFNGLLQSQVSHAFSAYDIQYVDLYNNAGLSRAPGSADFGANDLHPTDQGYDKIAAAWYAAVPEPTSLSLLGVGMLLLGRRQRHG